MNSNAPKNVYNEALQLCSQSPPTGFYRDGYCQTGPSDFGRHLVCARLTKDFLIYSKKQGNDLMTPRPDSAFPGLKPGDHWCLCASRWKEAFDDDKAPPIILAATHQKALEYLPLKVLQKYGIDDSMKQTIEYK